MSQAGAVFVGLAAIVVLAFLWVLRYLRDQQLRAAQDGRMMKSLRVALLRETARTPVLALLTRPPLFPALVREVPALRMESSSPWCSSRHATEEGPGWPG